MTKKIDHFLRHCLPLDVSCGRVVIPHGAVRENIMADRCSSRTGKHIWKLCRVVMKGLGIYQCQVCKGKKWAPALAFGREMNPCHVADFQT